jgi:hypothetical protein
MIVNGQDAQGEFRGFGAFGCRQSNEAIPLATCHRSWVLLVATISCSSCLIESSLAFIGVLRGGALPQVEPRSSVTHLQLRTAMQNWETRVSKLPKWDRGVSRQVHGALCAVTILSLLNSRQQFTFAGLMVTHTDIAQTSHNCIWRCTCMFVGSSYLGILLYAPIVHVLSGTCMKISASLC